MNHAILHYTIFLALGAHFASFFDFGFGLAIHHFKARGINHTSRSTCQRHGRMSRFLKETWREYGQQMTNMQTVGGWGKIAVERDFSSFNSASSAVASVVYAMRLWDRFFS